MVYSKYSDYDDKTQKQLHAFFISNIFTSNARLKLGKN